MKTYLAECVVVYITVFCALFILGQGRSLNKDDSEYFDDQLTKVRSIYYYDMSCVILEWYILV